jgi:hypothetical protein
MRHLVLSLLSLLAASSARASDPIGVYGFLQDVTVEPGGARVKLRGAFAFSQLARGTYSPPVTGYLYYACPDGKESVCRMEWEDLRMAAGSAGCVGYGMRRNPSNPSQPMGHGTVRPYGQPLGAPDVYPIGYGVSRVGEEWSTCAGLKAAAASTPATDPGTPEEPGGAGGLVPARGCSMGGRRGAGGLVSLCAVLGIAALARGRRRRS